MRGDETAVIARLSHRLKCERQIRRYSFVFVMCYAKALSRSARGLRAPNSRSRFQLKPCDLLLFPKREQISPARSQSCSQLSSNWDEERSSSGRNGWILLQQKNRWHRGENMDRNGCQLRRSKKGWIYLLVQLMTVSLSHASKITA